jgi:hypothetical protein
LQWCNSGAPTQARLSRPGLSATRTTGVREHCTVRPTVAASNYRSFTGVGSWCAKILEPGGHSGCILANGEAKRRRGLSWSV